MSQTNSPKVRFISSNWVLPVSEPPIPGGVVAIQAQRIKAVLQRDQFYLHFPGSTFTDYGRAILTPGLINLHTHLDYSAMRLFDTSSNLIRWISGLVKEAASWKKLHWQQSAAAGAQEAALSGTTCLADSSYSGYSAEAIAQIGLRATVALELFGLSKKDSGKRWQSWLDNYQSLVASADQELSEALSSGRIRLTVSPHAIYTVAPSLWRAAIGWAKDRHLPVLTHLCESEAEARWAAGVPSEIDEYYKMFTPAHAPATKEACWEKAGQTPVELLQSYQLLTATTVAAHCVWSTSSDLSTLSAAGVSVAHCTRSNARLRNGVAPLDSMLDSGINVGFGTDSAASTDDLDLVSEGRFSWNLHRATNRSFNRSSAEALEMMTLRAAAALNLDSQIGSLEAGKLADIAVWSIKEQPPAASNQPYDLLLYGHCTLQDLFVGGEAVVEAGVIKRQCVTPCPGQ